MPLRSPPRASALHLPFISIRPWAQGSRRLACDSLLEPREQCFRSTVVVASTDRAKAQRPTFFSTIDCAPNPPKRSFFNGLTGNLNVVCLAKAKPALKSKTFDLLGLLRRSWSSASSPIQGYEAFPSHVAMRRGRSAKTCAVKYGTSALLICSWVG